MKFAVHTEVERPLDETFERLSDCRNEEKWNSAVSSAKLVSDEPVRLGTKFNTINRGKLYEAVISRRDVPGDLAFEVVGKPMDITATYRLREQGGRVVIDGVLDMRPKGFMKLVMALGKRSIQKDLDRQYASFKRFCESSATAPTNGAQPT